MAITLKKIGNTIAAALTVAQSAQPVPKPSSIIRPKAQVQPETQSPFRTNLGGTFPQKNPDNLPLTQEAAKAKADAPKLVIKPKGTRWKPSPLTVSETPTPRQSQNLVDVGLEPTKLTGPILTGPKYDKCHIDTRVTITNNHFPWIKHYKPGDSGFVTHIGNNKDPMGIDDTSHLLHVIKIDKQADGKKDRLDQTAALFRWEFMIGEGMAESEWEGKKVLSE